MTFTQGTTITRRILFGVATLYVVYVLLLLMSFHVFSYQELLQWFIRQYPDGYLIHEYGTRFFTPDHFEFVRRSGFILIPLIIFLIAGLFFKSNLVIDLLKNLLDDSHYLTRSVAEGFRNLSQRNKVLLVVCFSVLLGIKIYLFCILPYYVDEVFNFAYFIKQGFFHTTFYTNNHTLYNLISALWWKVGISPMVSSRLTALLSGMSVHVLLYGISRRHLGFKPAVGVMMLSGVTFWSNIYSVEGSAYMLMTLFVVISLTALLRMTSNNGGGYLFIVSCVLGFYSSKVFVIPYLSFIILWIFITLYQKKSRTTILKIFKLTVAVLFFTGLLYLPMLLWSGTESVLVTHVAKQDLVADSSLLLENFSVMTELNTKSYILVGAVFFFCLVCFRKASEALKTLIAINAASLLSLSVFIALVHLYPPSRSVIYSNVLFYVLIAVGIASCFQWLKITSNLSTGSWVVIILIKAVGSWYLFNHGWQNFRGSFQDRAFYERLHRLTHCIVDSKPNLVYVDDENTFVNFYLRLAAIQQGVALRIIYDNNAIEQPDVVILQEDDRLPDQYVGLVGDEFGRVLVRKELEEREGMNGCLRGASGF
jgi:hypothetical protein